ncbi:MAG TPA: IS110 family transposase [Ktedonobacterales bacterium]|nr:IS110 family transposase [Ktedonobacterales bacterium]
MRVVHERCAGLDVHKSSVVACAMLPEGKQLRTFGTMTGHLEQLAEWLHGLGVTVVAMESSGVYWKPVFNILEVAGFELLVVNARHIKAVPGRKTDVKDAEWIADLLRHGLLKPSFIPNREERELRELTRYRRTLIEERAHEVQRLQKVLEGANIKLEDVISNVVGLNGRRFLNALIEGDYDPEVVAATANYGLQRKQELLAQALHGTFGTHQRFLLDQLRSHIDFLEQRIAALDQEVQSRTRPFEPLIARLDQIPGLGTRAAQEILAEIGTDMSRFPSHRHLASWAKVCPGNNQSAGKRRSGYAGKGNRWLRSILVECAWCATRKKDSYFKAQYHRLAARRGQKRALLAVGHTLLTVIYHLLRDGVLYQDLGPNYFDQRDRSQIARQAIRRLERLGYHVSLTEGAA